MFDDCTAGVAAVRGPPRPADGVHVLPARRRARAGERGRERGAVREREREGAVVVTVVDASYIQPTVSCSGACTVVAAVVTMTLYTSFAR